MISRIKTSLQLLTFFSLFLISCSNEPTINVPVDIAAMENVAVYSGETEPQYEISFTENARFGETEEILIRAISGIAVAEDGTLFLGDRLEATVHVYGPSGDHSFSLGGKGEGPGEFIRVDQLKLYGGYLHVLDVQQQRVSVFDPENGQHLRTHMLSNDGSDLSGFPFRFEPLSGGRYLAYYNSMNLDGENISGTLRASVLDGEANVLENDFIDFKPSSYLMLQDDNSIQIMQLAFMNDSKVSITPDEEIIWGYTDRLLLHIVDLDGNVKRSVYYSREKPTLNRSDLLDNYDAGAIRDAIGSLDLPDTKPAFNSIYTDDEYRVWLSLPTEDDEEFEWWILNEAGEKQALFTKNSEDRLLTAKDGFVYFLETEEETGLQEVVKYRVEFN